MKCDNCGYENSIGTLLKPELRSANRTYAPDFSVGSMTFSYAALVAGANGDQLALPINDLKFKPHHIGAVPGQPVAAYLVIRDTFVTLITAGGLMTANGIVVYRDLKRVEHFLCAFAQRGDVPPTVYQNSRQRVVSENPIAEYELQSLGDIFIRLGSAITGAGTLDVQIRVNFGVQYGV